MRISVFGPNLRDQSKGGLHVHAADCGDICKMKRSEPEYNHPMTWDAASVKEVVIKVYPPSEFQWDEEDDSDYSMYVSDFYFFPCCKALPAE